MNKSKPKIKYAVMLTKQAIQLLQNDSIQLFIKDGTYFNCLDYHIDSHYLRMEVDYHSFDEKDLVFEILIPHQYVLYIGSVYQDKVLGFQVDENKIQQHN